MPYKVPFCDDCGTQELESLMIRNEVWLSVARSDSILCLPCLENRLKRFVVLSDLKPCQLTSTMFVGAYIGKHTKTLPSDMCLLYATKYGTERKWIEPLPKEE